MQVSDSQRTTGFPRSVRLLSSGDYQAIFKRPVVCNDRLFRVYGRALKNATPGATSRLGLAISRKAAPRAVDRNRIKRYVREAFRHFRVSLDEDGPVEFIVMARPEARLADGAELQCAIIALFKRTASRARAVTEAS